MAETHETGELFGVDMDHVAGTFPLIEMDGFLGSRFLSRLSPRVFITCQTVERGALRAMAIRRSVQCWCHKYTACCSCCGSSVRRGPRKLSQPL